MKNSIKDDILKIYNSNYLTDFRYNTDPIFISFNNFLSIFGSKFDINYLHVLNSLYPLNNFNDEMYQSVDITNFYRSEISGNLIYNVFNNDYSNNNDIELKDILIKEEIQFNFLDQLLLKELFNSLKNNLEFIEHFSQLILDDFKNYIFDESIKDKFKIKIFSQDNGRLNMFFDVDDALTKDELNKINQTLKIYVTLNKLEIKGKNHIQSLSYKINLYQILNDLNILTDEEINNIQTRFYYLFEDFNLFDVNFSNRLNKIFNNESIEQVNHLQNFEVSENLTLINEIKIENEIENEREAV